MSNKSIIEIIEEVKEDICSNYCKYPSMYSPEDWEENMDEICSNCPLDRL